MLEHPPKEALAVLAREVAASVMHIVEHYIALLFNQTLDPRKELVWENRNPYWRRSVLVTQALWAKQLTVYVERGRKAACKPVE